MMTMLTSWQSIGSAAIPSALPYREKGSGGIQLPGVDSSNFTWGLLPLRPLVIIFSSIVADMDNTRIQQSGP
jgi:hypothetical protein